MLSAVSIRGIRARGVALAGVLLTVLMMFGSAFAAAPAFAAPINATISEAKFDRGSAGYGESVGFSFNWAVPNGSVAGDTFTIVLPNEIRPANTADFVLNSSAHGPVGKAVWSGNTATITLTNAVKGLSNVKGNGYFNVGWDGNAVDRANGGSYNLYFSGTNNWSLPLTLLPDGLGGDGQSTSKVGMWLSPDQGASSPLHQLGWGVYLDTGTDKPVTAPVVITDTPGPTSIIDITTVVGYDGNATIPTNRYTVVREGERGVRIELRGNYPGETAIYDGENIVFRYKSDILPGDTGIFTNSAVVSGIKSAPEAVSARILRDGAGGNGDGDLITLAPVVPEVTQSACAADGSVVAPKVVLAETEGMTYSTQGEVVAGGKVTVTATAGEGFVLSPVDGWTLSEDKRSATMVVELADVDCEKPLVEAAPVVPQVTESVCDADGVASVPVVNTVKTAGIAYSTQGEVVAGGKVTVTATAGEGFVLSPVDGWTLSGDKLTATMVVELADVECEKPLVEAAPVAPKVTQASCSADGTVVDPKVVLGESEGIKYTSKGDIVAGGKVTVTATAGEGFVLSPVDGWTLSGDKLTATMIVELENIECEKPLVEAAPVVPHVTESVCDADGVASVPVVKTVKTAGITYSTQGEVVAGGKVTVTATAGEGFVLSPVDGWTLSEDKLTATMVVELADVDCEKPLVEAAPVVPQVTESVCDADGVASVPVVKTVKTAGITYSTQGEVVAGGKVTVTATAGEGFVLSPVDGWTLSEDKLTATMVVELADVDCKKPVDNSTDTPAKKPVVKDPTLAKTGGLEPGIFLAPAAALLLIAGLAFVAAKRRVQ